MKEGRAAYFGVLRNLTPQILMLSLAFFLGRKIDFYEIRLVLRDAHFYILCFHDNCRFAAYANATLFMEKFSPITDNRYAQSSQSNRQDAQRPLTVEDATGLFQAPMAGVIRSTPDGVCHRVWTGRSFCHSGYFGQ
jgi:hypothetical protein